MFWKSEKATPKPICSVLLGEELLLECYWSGEEFFKEVWKFSQQEKVHITFGHKFFFWANHKNRERVWIRNRCGLNLNDWDSWSKLSGEIEIIKDKNKHTGFLVINVTNGR